MHLKWCFCIQNGDFNANIKAADAVTHHADEVCKDRAWVLMEVNKKMLMKSTGFMVRSNGLPSASYIHAGD